MTAAIECDELTRTFGSITALDHLSVTIDGPGVIGVLGPNGAGKTTLMRVLTTALAPTTGHARVAGHDITRDPVAVRRHIGFSADSVPLPGESRAGELLELVGRLRGLDHRDAHRRSHDVLDRVGLNGFARRRVAELSKGQRQRVGLATALIADPPVLLLDEPTAGLDPEQVVDARALIADLADRHTVLFSSHLLSEVESICDRVLIIDRGRRLADHTIADLRHELGLAPTLIARTTALTDTAVERITREFHATITIDRPNGHVTITTTADHDTAPRLARTINELGADLHELRVQPATLEDAFLRLTHTPTGVSDR